MPICTLLAPRGLTDAAKAQLMEKMTAHIDEAYPMYGTYIFVQEADRTDAMLDGALLLDNPAAPPKDGRIFSLRCPPGARAEAKKTMMAKLTADIDEAYPNKGTTFIIHIVDDLGSVMINGLLQSEDPRNTTPA